MRVPRMTGLPSMTRRLISIRSESAKCVSSSLTWRHIPAVGDGLRRCWAPYAEPNLPGSLALRGSSYFKGKKATPQPLMLIRHAGHGSMDSLCGSTLALTKMDWNNDGPYDMLPVTLSYAHVLASIVKRMPRLEARPYPFRFFM